LSLLDNSRLAPDTLVPLEGRYVQESRLPHEIGLLTLVAIMWFSHVLLGLVSLAGLTAAAPTSAGASIQVVDDAPTLLKARYPVDSRAAKALAVHARAIEDRPVQTLDAQGLP
jgi:hypothetical protein